MLPHVWSAGYRVRYMASDPIEAEEVFLLLEEQLKEREVQAWEQKEKFEIPVILFVSDVSLLEGASIQRYISALIITGIRMSMEAETAFSRRRRHWTHFIRN